MKIQTKKRILGVLVVLGLTVISLPMLMSSDDDTPKVQVALKPPFPSVEPHQSVLPDTQVAAENIQPNPNPVLDDNHASTVALAPSSAESIADQNAIASAQNIADKNPEPPKATTAVLNSPEGLYPSETAEEDDSPIDPNAIVVIGADGQVIEQKDFEVIRKNPEGNTEATQVEAKAAAMQEPSLNHSKAIPVPTMAPQISPATQTNDAARTTPASPVSVQNPVAVDLFSQTATQKNPSAMNTPVLATAVSSEQTAAPVAAEHSIQSENDSTVNQSPKFAAIFQNVARSENPLPSAVKIETAKVSDATPLDKEKVLHSAEVPSVNTDGSQAMKLPEANTNWVNSGHSIPDSAKASAESVTAMTTKPETGNPSDEMNTQVIAKVVSDKVKQIEEGSLVKEANLSPKEKTLQTELAHLKQMAWVVQMGSFRDPKNAERLTNTLRAKGYKAFTYQTKPNALIHVYVGPEPKHMSALSLMDKMQDDIDIHGIVVPYKPLEI